MNEYINVLANIGLPAVISECANGRIKCPLEGFEAPPYWYGYPPALIPIWSEGARPQYLGFWKHWFIDREPSFVQMYVASGRMTIEIARTLEQFLCFVTMSAIVEKDEITSDIEKFAQRVGLNNLSQLDDITIKTGDDPYGFIALSAFSENSPLNCLKNTNDYTGGFYVSSQKNKETSFENISEFELGIDVSIHSEFPLWINCCESSKLKVFRQYLEEGELGRAWLTLNSRGWAIAEARIAIIELAEVAKDNKFNMLVSAWLSVAKENVGYY